MESVIPSTGDIKAKVHDIVLNKAAQDFKQNPLFQDSNPNAKKNKETYINTLAAQGHSREDLHNVAEQVRADTGGDINNTPETYKSPTEGEWGVLQPIADWSNEFANKAVTQVKEGAKKAAKGALEYETGQPIKGGLEMATGATQVAFNVLPPAIEFNAATDAIKTLADKNLSKDNAAIVSAAMDTPFSMVTKVASKLGYTPEEDSSGQMFLSLLDFVAAAGAFKAGEGIKSKIKSAKDLQEISKKVADNTATPQENIELNKFVAAIPAVTVDDIQKVAEKQDTPQAKEIVAKIDAIKPPEIKASPELEQAHKEHQDLINTEVTPELQPFKDKAVADSQAKIDKHLEQHADESLQEARDKSELNHINTEIDTLEKNKIEHKNIPTLVKLFDDKLVQLKNRKDEISKSIPQGEYGEIPEGDSRNEKVASELRGRIGEAQENISIGEGGGRRELLKHLSQEEKQGVLRGGEINAGATDVVRGVQSSGIETKREGGKLVPGTERLKEEDALKDYAKNNSVWIKKEFGKPDLSGKEQDVYLNEDGKTVTKVNSNDAHETWKDFFDRIAIHNTLFPDVAYTVKGFTEHNGLFSIVTEQPLIKGKEVGFHEIKREMANMGFDPMFPKSKSSEERNSFINKDKGVIVKDLHGENVIKGEDGKLHFIDPVIEFTNERKTKIKQLNSKENAVQISSPEGLLQPPQEGVGETGSERSGVEPIQQGTETSKEGESEGQAKTSKIESPKEKTILMEHGDDERDFDKEVGGVHDTDLVERGEKAVKKAAEKFKEEGVTKVYHSPIERAFQTARILQDKANVSLHPTNGLGAWNIGNFDGMDRVDFEKAQEYFVNNPDALVYPEMPDFKLKESFNDFKDRATKTYNDIINKGEKGVAILTHSKNIKLIRAIEDNGGWNEAAKKEFLSKENKIGNAEIEVKNPKVDFEDKLKSGDLAKEVTSGEKSVDDIIKESEKEGVKIDPTTLDILKTKEYEALKKEKEVKGKTPTEPPVTPPQKEDIKYSDPEMTKMANAINDSFIEGKFGAEAMDNIIKQLQDTDLVKIYEKVKEDIKKGVIDTKEVRERVLQTKTGSERDQAVLLYDMAELKGKERELTKAIIDESDLKKKAELQKQLMETQNSMIDNTIANRNIGRSASTIFRIRQVWADKDANLSNMMEQYKASKGVKELSKEQEAEITKAYNKIRDLENTIRDLETNEGNLIKENEVLQKLLASAKEQKRADRGIKADTAISKSKERIQKSKDKLRSLRGQLSAGINPEIAIEISKIAAEHVYQGVVKVDVLVKNVLDDIKDIFPDFTEKDVKEHLAHVNKQKTFEEKIAKLEESKKGKTQEEIKAIDKLIADKTANEKIREKIKGVGAVIKKTLQIEGKTERKDYEPVKRKIYEESDALKEAKKQYAIERFKWEVDRRQDMMRNRSIGEKIGDSIIRWQRFAILSYPSTLVKLMAVVGHGLLLKPFQFATQALVHSLLPKGISEKTSLWGKPSVKALGAYYGKFIRNFALSNLKEHLTGVDAKEAQYGKPFIYDEWSLGRGILEMPGRSHGYIKSFIKNPEFTYAHTQILESYLNKMQDIQEQLKKPDLSAKDRNKLEADYKTYDVTKEDVVDRANRLALVHGKWAILMNDTKGTDKLKTLLNDKSFGGYLIKTELPIVKIPFNFIGRALNTKYGLLTALTGKGFGKEHSKGLAEVLYKGAESLKPEEAELISRSLTIGTMGATLFALGYMNKGNAKENEDGSWEINGTHVPKTLLHLPLYESFLTGALTAQGQDKKGKNGGIDWIKNLVESDISIVKNNPFSSMLRYGFTGNLMTAIFKTKNKDQMENKIQDAVNQKVANMLIPGLVKQAAQSLDTKESGIHPLLPAIKRRPYKGGAELKKLFQEMELGIPVLRKDVPKSRK